jgi:hypothetical protein
MDMGWKDFIEIIAVPLYGGMVWLLWKTRDDCLTKLKETQEDLDQFKNRAYARLDSAHTEVADVRTQVSSWQLEIVRTYATKSDLEKLEKRIDAGFDRLELKLDKLVHQRRNTSS